MDSVPLALVNQRQPVHLVARLMCTEGKQCLHCVTFPATLLLNPEHCGLHASPPSGSSRVTTPRGDRLSVCCASPSLGNCQMHISGVQEMQQSQ